MPAVLAPPADAARPTTPRVPAFTPPSRALTAAMGDPALRRHGCAAQVLVILHELLTPTEFRRVKPWYVAERLGIHRVQASRAISHLATSGLIERGERVGCFPTFRLPPEGTVAAA